jgi:hypothetical protein
MTSPSTSTSTAMSTSISAGLSFEAIAAEAAAARALARLYEHPDAIFHGLLGAAEACHGGRATLSTIALRSFCRQIQKHLEQVRP